MAVNTDLSLRRQVIYSVFVRGHTKEGTFRALEGDLDRLKVLGADILWLMPIHPIGEEGRKGTMGSPYAIRDYRAVNPDMGTVDEDGYFRVTGRIKDMIIRGGENIYPKEIEEFIYTHPAVKDVQVIGVPDKKYGEEAMACIILKEPGSVTVEEMLDYIKASMARHKVPKYIDFVDAFPMNAAGKILKYKMREEATERFGLEGAAGIDTAQTAEQVKR